MKEKMLMKLERDRVKAKNEAIEAQIKAMQVRYHRHTSCLVTMLDKNAHHAVLYIINAMPS